jgi:hypothetical protein
VKLEVTQLAQRLFAEQLAQFKIEQVTHVPLVLTVRLLAQDEQKSLAEQRRHCWTLQLAQTEPFLIGFPEEQAEQTLGVLQRVHEEILQRTQPPLEAVYGALQPLHESALWQVLQFDTLHDTQTPPVPTEKRAGHCPQKLGEEHETQLGTLH